MKPIQILPALAALALVACGSNDTPQDETPIPVEPDGGIGDGAGPPPVAVDDVPEAIPAALRGRWGLVAADCEAGRADAKGLMVVSPTDLTFYESVGTLGAVASGDANRLRATFSFTGEGMEWTRDMELSRQPGGDQLIRQEFGEDAAAEPFVYNRCDMQE